MDDGGGDWPMAYDVTPLAEEDPAQDGWPVPVDAFQVLPSDYRLLPPAVASDEARATG